MCSFVLRMLACAAAASVAAPALAAEPGSTRQVVRLAQLSAVSATSTGAEADPAPAARELSLQQALQAALQRHPRLAAAEQEVQALAAAERQAGAAPNPELSALVEDTRPETRTTTLQIAQPIELGGKRSARLESARLAREQGELARLEQRAAVAAELRVAYQDVLVAQERARLAAQALELAQGATQAAAKRVRAGKIAPIDETRARLAEADVRLQQGLAAGELRSARQRLALAMGEARPGFDNAAGSAEALPPKPAEDLLARLQEAPALRRARLEVAHRVALAELERADGVPDVTLTLGAKRPEELGRNQAVIGVSMPLPAWGGNRGSQLAALRRADQARAELAGTELRLQAELHEAEERLRAAREEARTLREELLPGAERAHAATATGFELGKFGWLDVLEAQRSLIEARQRLLGATLAAHRAAADIGRLLGEDAVSTSSAASASASASH